jgi:hypothetical protein
MNVADLPGNLVSKITVNDGTGCWEWTAATSSSGYGVGTVRGQTTSAHRLTYMELVAPIPEGLEIDHLCCNKLCVNPDHLETVTRQENMRRYIERTGRAAKPRVSKRAPRQHGERRTYVAGCRCDECRAANRQCTYLTMANMWERGLQPDDPRHGTVGAYKNWRCRCSDCLVAGSEANRRSRERRAARAAA